MAQADGVVANGTGSAVRADINGQLAALFTNHSGSTEPATTFAFQTWADTNTNTLKLRNSSNDGWVQLARLDGQFDAKTFNSNVTLNAQSDLRFADSDSSNWVAFQAPATVASNVTWTLPSADGTADQALTTNGSGVLSWADAGGGDNITEGNTSAEVVDTGSDGHFKVVTEGTEALRVDPSQRLLVGTATVSAYNQYGQSPRAQVVSSGGSLAGLLLEASSSDGNNLVFRKSGGSAGSNTVVTNNQEIGTIRFTGTDGTNPFDVARIAAEIDGSPGANDMPGRLVFSTTADAASSPTEQLRITSDRYVRLASGTGGIQFGGDTAAANALDDYEEGTWTPSVSNMTTTGSPAYGGRYRKIGSQVTVWFFTTTGSGVATYASTANSTNVSGLPFASGYDGPAQSGGPPGVAINGTTSAGGFLQGPGSSGTTFYFNTTISATQGMSASLTYYV